MKDTAVEAGSHVVESAKSEAAGVMEEAKYESRRVFDEGMRELRVQAGNGQNQLTGFVRSLSGELGSMGNSTDQSGPMVDLVRSLERYGRDTADWLEHNEPEEVLDSVRRYAARKPWAFLAISAGVGFVGARLVRGLQGAKSDEDDRRSASRRYDSPARASYSSGAGTAPGTYGTGSRATGATGGAYPSQSAGTGGAAQYPSQPATGPGGAGQYPSQPTTGSGGAGQYPSQPSSGSGYVEGYPPPSGGASGGATTQNPMPGQGYPPSSPQGGQGTRHEDLR
ncbi:hypothetical protein LKO27_10935 [Tessaracoccus sp. OS52]|uniref:hypothetical protein n=1 Tax=Tessaracoccus sp. OS52 TaxID=2886691 RepID=UPI001D1181C3|nr:hypothetical protein [Tessaracoccus sp. OS52]MCC2593919.1 hypothetical protein [Tessaracoccus sp. OS52]